MIDIMLRSKPFKTLPRCVRYTIGYTVSYSRRFWWGIIRSECAQRRKILYNEIEWSGKMMHPDDLDELVADQRPNWRRWGLRAENDVDHRIL
jgi:hypothetical protein